MAYKWQNYDFKRTRSVYTGLSVGEFGVYVSADAYEKMDMPERVIVKFDDEREAIMLSHCGKNEGIAVHKNDTDKRNRPSGSISIALKSLMPKGRYHLVNTGADDNFIFERNV